MRRLPDYHTHTSATEDGTATFEEMVRAGAEKGLEEMLVNDHYIIGIPNYQVTRELLDGYFESRERLERETGMKILIGLEMDYFADHLEEIEKVLSWYEYDMIIGAAHFVDGWGVASQGHALSFFKENDKPTCYRKAIGVLGDAVETGLFDIMAHLDILRKFTTEPHGTVPFSEYEEEAERVAELMLKTGTGFEINCRGYDHQPGEPYPTRDFIDLMKRKGVDTVTLGSDSHSTDLVGADLERGARVLRDAGFENLTIFRKRKPEKVPLAEFDIDRC